MVVVLVTEGIMVVVTEMMIMTTVVVVVAAAMVVATTYHHPHFFLHSSSPGSPTSTDFTDQALLIHCSNKKFLTIWHVLNQHHHHHHTRAGSYHLMCLIPKLKVSTCITRCCNMLSTTNIPLWKYIGLLSFEWSRTANLVSLVA